MRNRLLLKRLFSFFPFLFLFLHPSFVYSECNVPQPFAFGTSSSAAEYAKKGRNSLDENGILIFDYGKSYDYLGKWHNPYFIAQYANALYADWYKTKCTDESLKNAFLRQANFLISSHKLIRKKMAYWIYPFPNSRFGVDPGWISGIGQSQIAGVLLRAYGITKEKRFKYIAKKAIEVYFHDTSRGGVVTESNKDLWIQEVPCPKGKSFNILNGHISGLFGVLDVANLTKDQRLNLIFDRGINTVKNNIHKFDAGFTSFYSLTTKEGSNPIIAPIGNYNYLHVWQLNKLWEITGEEIFNQYSILFDKYEKIIDIRNSKGSTDPTKHGPDKAAGKYGLSYWSHSEFPTWYEVDMKENQLLDGIFIDGHTKNSSPRELSISVILNGSWVEIYHTDHNEMEHIYISFIQPLLTSKIRIDIINDNGNKNVALDAVMPIRSLNNYSSILSPSHPTASLSTLSPGFRQRSYQLKSFHKLPIDKNTTP